MKQKKQYHHLKVIRLYQPMYPNAADPNYFKQKALDVMTAIVSGLGFASAMVFLVTMA